MPFNTYLHNRFLSRNERGVAILIVLSIITLLSIIMLSLSASTYLLGRTSTTDINRFKAEYILKSGLNIARVLISSSTTEYDPPKEGWGKFTRGMEVPSDLLGLTDPNIHLALEITAEDGKLSMYPLKYITSSSSSTVSKTYLKYRDYFKNLFDSLGFQNDKELVKTGQFKGRFFKSEELVGNLIDYLDNDNTSYSDGIYKGIEGELKENIFPEVTTKDNKFDNLNELSIIPGFTPARIKKVSPYITTVQNVKGVNVNLTSKTVLKALDPDINDDRAKAILDFAHSEKGPFTNKNINELKKLLPDPTLTSILQVSSEYLQVIGKVQYGEARFFMRAIVKKNTGGALPEVQKFELFG